MSTCPPYLVQRRLPRLRLLGVHVLAPRRRDALRTNERNTRVSRSAVPMSKSFTDLLLRVGGDGSFFTRFRRFRNENRKMGIAKWESENGAKTNKLPPPHPSRSSMTSSSSPAVALAKSLFVLSALMAFMSAAVPWRGGAAWVSGAPAVWARLPVLGTYVTGPGVRGVTREPEP